MGIQRKKNVKGVLRYKAKLVAKMSNVFPKCFRASRSLLGLSPRKHDMM